MLSSEIDTQTACRACRLGFLILEPVTQRNPNRCTQQLGLVSILGTRNATSYPNPLSRYFTASFLTKATTHQDTRTKQDVRMRVRESGLNV